jgi:hypothetical protein
MKRLIALILVLVLAFSLVACSKNDVSTLTVTTILFLRNADSLPTAVIFEDNRGNEVTFEQDPSTWFTNASFISASSEGYSLEGKMIGGAPRIVLTDGFIVYVFVVDDVKYDVNIGNGTVFNVTPDGESYKVTPSDDWVIKK